MRDLFRPCLQLLENLQLCGGKFCNSEKSQDQGNLMPHSVTSLLHTSQNSWTSYGIAYKMRDFSAKALVHSVYLLTLFLRNVYKVLSNLRSRSLTPPLSLFPLPSSSPYLSSASLSFFKSVFSLLPAPQTRAAI